MLSKTKHGDVLELQLSRPPVNALHHPLVTELKSAIEAAPKEGAKALVLSGMSGMFSAGLDVAFLLQQDQEGMQRFWRDFFGMLRSVATSPIPIVAAMTGHSPAGGAVIAIYCDYRIAAQGKFKIGLNEVQVGLPVPRVILAGLTRIVGPRHAERLAVRGMLVSPDEALAAGLVDEVVGPEQVVPKAIEWCRSALKLPQGALHTTRNSLRADYATMFDTLASSTEAEMTAVWFSAETQQVLKDLMAQLSSRKR